jgi:anti-anti-sigma regulatory factor
MIAPVRVKQQKTQTHVSLHSSVGIAQVQELYQLLSPVIARGLPVVLDASKVERIDTAVLQLFAVFSQSLQKKGVPLRLKKASDAFFLSSELLGLQTEFTIET